MRCTCSTAVCGFGFVVDLFVFFCYVPKLGVRFVLAFFGVLPFLAFAATPVSCPCCGGRRPCSSTFQLRWLVLIYIGAWLVICFMLAFRFVAPLVFICYVLKFAFCGP